MGVLSVNAISICSISRAYHPLARPTILTCFNSKPFRIGRDKRINTRANLGQF